jgi:uncharacterized protein YlxP (DUF503 family)
VLRAAVVVYDLHIPLSASLKDRRAAITPIIEGARRRFAVSVAEVAGQSTWQRAGIAVACVASSGAHLEDVLSSVDRFVWSFPEVDVLSTRRAEIDGEDLSDAS